MNVKSKSIFYFYPDIDEWLTGENNCSHVAAVCNNNIGSYINCTCKEGYVGDGRNCSGKISFVIIFILYCYKTMNFYIFQ